MDIRQLKYFLTIAREGQVTRAAKLLNMEQPPLSRALKQMEDELNVKLFDRNGKGLQLTEAGQLLKIKAEQLLRQFSETMEEIKEFEQGVTGILNIGAVFSCISLLPQPLQRFRQKFPDVTFKILEGDHYYIGEQLENRSVDIVFVRLPFEGLTDPHQLMTYQLPSDPFVVVVPSQWQELKGLREISLEQLCSYPIVTLKTERTTHMHEQVVQHFYQNGLTPNVVCECSSVAITVALIAEGIGAALLPQSVMSSFRDPRVTMLPLETGTLQSDFALMWLKDHYLPKNARYFIEDIIKQASEPT